VIALRALAVRRGSFALGPISLVVPSGTYLVLLGPSGAGKTTLLEAVAGLVPAAGEVHIAGRDRSREPPEGRAVGLVTQDALLFPHLSVAQNLAFGLRTGPRMARAARAAAVGEAAGLAGCAHLLARRPADLSGGERQRVALARALVRRPDVLLLDEPLGALDLPLRREIRDALRRLVRHLGTTVVHVTHDLEEALALADLLGVLDRGELAQVAPPAEVWQRPATPAVATLLGTENILHGVIEADGARDPAPFPARLRAHAVTLRGLAQREGPGHAALRAEDIALSREPVTSSALNQLPASVTAVTPLGALVRVTLDAGVPLVALVTRESAAALALTAGTRVHLSFKATAVHLF
jgi:molybdopterin-binding protein